METKSLSPKSKNLSRLKFPSKSEKSLHKNSSPLNSTEITNSIISPYALNSSTLQRSLASRLNLRLKTLPPNIQQSISSQKTLRKLNKQYTFINKQPIFSQKNLTEQILPLSAKKTIFCFSQVLSNYELQEISEFKKIFYLGLKAKKIVPDSNSANYGFDDYQTHYIPIIGDQIAYRYEILEILGSGSFAQVVKCLDHKTQKEVAIKIIKSHKSFFTQAQTELKILLFLRNEMEKLKNSLFVNVLGYFQFRNHLCIIFELLSFNLYDLLKANNFKGFTMSLVRRLSSQILQALVILSENDIIHCDLKPENIVLISPNESSIKLIDFGSSCFTNERIYSYIQSRIYRAPEVILGVPYTSSIDMWSFGCIVVELFTGVPLFVGENESDQLNAIIEVIGMPPANLLEKGLKTKKFFGPKAKLKNAGTPTEKIRNPGTKKIEDIVKTNNSNFFHFVLRCLEWNPEKRITAFDALEHPWMKEIVNIVKNPKKKGEKKYLGKGKKIK